MDEVIFRVRGLAKEDFKRLRKQVLRPPGGNHLLLGTVLFVATVYATNHPGEIVITSPAGDTPTNGATVEVAGTVDNKLTPRVVLTVNGSSRSLLVENGRFSTKVPLIRGDNFIQASASGVISNLLAGSNLVRISADIPSFDIWTELTWEGQGDVDLHLYLPNGEHVYYKQMTSASGALLDIDNRERDGPEHIAMQTAIPGQYRVSVHYFAQRDRSSLEVPWQVMIRLRDGAFCRYSGVLRTEDEEQTVDTFTF